MTHGCIPGLARASPNRQCHTPHIPRLTHRSDLTTSDTATKTKRSMVDCVMRLYSVALFLVARFPSRVFLSERHVGPLLCFRLPFSPVLDVKSSEPGTIGGRLYSVGRRKPLDGLVTPTRPDEFPVLGRGPSVLHPAACCAHPVLPRRYRAPARYTKYSGLIPCALALRGVFSRTRWLAPVAS